mgnify:FL=1
MNSINNNKANITIQSINEKIPSTPPSGGSPGTGSAVNTGQNTTETEESNQSNRKIGTFLVVLVLVVIIIVIISLVVYYINLKIKHNKLKKSVRLLI